MRKSLTNFLCVYTCVGFTAQLCFFYFLFVFMNNIIIEENYLFNFSYLFSVLWQGRIQDLKKEGAQGVRGLAHNIFLSNLGDFLKNSAQKWVGVRPLLLMCGILCNRDNCKRGPLSQVGPRPPTCLIRPWVQGQNEYASTSLWIQYHITLVAYCTHSWQGGSVIGLKLYPSSL